MFYGFYFNSSLINLFASQLLTQVRSFVAALDVRLEVSELRFFFLRLINPAETS
jgi:hypothetical protein